ncbi:LuxS/MPP-like metallohydrolase [Coemansia reversa NRRL 1564]|uniref:LuxS/MPP-like metallohydrolase n=1 Tax=Coemansia reversa (strain ATCC 12441 / NRRL 1564) TaxID=763665 RepID=A0A2G5B9K2_COERN|nr:LuxS/MPP-like metallohydrolase [Coemansia reversa NRRL 1564]|eukprot:PIA15407.1 LuxS/MPP-like metallohydrolase [Coemansia reversa NRRL 1564]
MGLLEKSAMDKCQYRLLRLPNNMVVICISDPDSETAAAALTVGVGSYADPADALGLAHLLEHMLPISSARYPEVEEHSTFIKNNSGSSNAYTDCTETCFYFDIGNEALDGALDRMSDFLINPLLSADAIGREVNVIDSEFQLYLTSDMRRLDRLKSHLSNPNHPHSQFTIGNCKTLGNFNPKMLHKKVVEFYNRYYSADIMKLAIRGNWTLDELTEMAVSRFSAVKSKGITKLTFADHPMTKNELGKVTHFETINFIFNIDLTFPLSDIRAHYKGQAIEYITWLLNHKGSGSLAQYLYSQGLAIYTVAVIRSYEAYAFLDVSISATSKGLEQYDQVVSAIFTYLHMISKSKPQEWIYNEISASYLLEFEYYEQPQPTDHVIKLSRSATNDYIPPEYIVSNGLVISGFNSSLISAFMDLLNPTNYSLFIGAPSHEGVTLSNTEKYYNVHYHVSELPNKLTTDFCQDNSMLNYFHLPKPNDFFTDNFSVPEPTGPRPKLDKTVPTLLKYNDGLELWHKQDDKFYLPKGVIVVEIKSPVINSSPRNWVMFDMLCHCWRYMLTEELYNAKCAGLSYSISGFNTAVNVTVEGFNQKLPLLLERVISNMCQVAAKQSKFNDCLAAIQENLSYIWSNSAIDQGYFWKSKLFLCPAWDATLLEECIDDVKYEMLNNFFHALFDQVHVTMLVTGNFTEQQAMDIALNVQKVIGGQALPACQKPQIRVLQFDPGYYILPRVGISEGNSQNITVVSINLGKYTNVFARITADLLDNLFNKALYTQLRTKEQLGYIVKSFILKYEDGNCVLDIVIQSKSNPIYISLRISEFLRTYRQNLVNLDKSKLATIIKLVIKSKQERLTSISNEASRMWNTIESGEYDFENVREEIECLKTIGKQDIIEMWDTYINSDTAPQYTRTDVHIWPTNSQLPSAAELENYPASVIALQSLLRDSTDSDINLEELDGFVMAASMDGNQEDAYEKLMILYPVLQELEDSPPTDNSDGEGSSSNELDPRTEKIKIGLQMALESAVNPPDYHKHCSVDFANIGMCQTCEGIWVINDIAKFQRTQKLNGLPISATRLIPKYKD